MGLVSTLSFRVKTCRAAHVLLTHGTTSWRGGEDMYEIVVGGEASAASEIRQVVGGKAVATELHPTGPLSCSQFRTFYVSWGGGVVEVGLELDNPEMPGGGSKVHQPFMTHVQSSLFLVHHVFVSGGDRPATWLIGRSGGDW